MNQINRSELAKAIHENAVAKGFWDEKHSPEHYLMLVITELSEAVEAWRNGRYHYKAAIHVGEEEEEIWKPVVGYEEDYEISSLGRVRSKDMKVWNGRVFHTKKGRILSPGIGGAGYRTVSLRGKTHKVARMVAEAFLIKREGETYVNHIDGDKQNDNIANLEWCTPSENIEHAYKTGLKNTKSKLTYAQKVQIAFLHKSGVGYRTIHKHTDFGVSASAIQRICYSQERYTDSVEFELADAYIRLLDLAEGFGYEVEYDGDDALEKRVKGNTSFITDIYSSISWVMLIRAYETVGRSLEIIERFADKYNIDLAWHIAEKMKYNATRPRLHGKKC